MLPWCLASLACGQCARATSQRRQPLWCPVQAADSGLPSSSFTGLHAGGSLQGQSDPGLAAASSRAAAFLVASLARSAKKKGE